ncbi:hypothetical protein MRB53_027562 [Persea americana]|uniref:Uncharacterized protein n=1 Tax=Persea americana TaxID=3435 RepID=A0ACC2LL75_PERAE|nr:hypothetical protein MRB53_027562 [Persea americana]
MTARLMSASAIWCRSSFSFSLPQSYWTVEPCTWIHSLALSKRSICVPKQLTYSLDGVDLHLVNKQYMIACILVCFYECSLKNLDRSQPECKTHLLSLLQKKADMTQLIEIVEWLSHEDIQCHREDMEKMIRMAVWCLQDDPDRRPTMSVVVKVLEGLIEVETSISYRFCHAMVSATEAGFHPVSTPPQDSVLSTPR